MIFHDAKRWRPLPKHSLQIINERFGLFVCSKMASLVVFFREDNFS
jgi:hypothetical protein